METLWNIYGQTWDLLDMPGQIALFGLGNKFDSKYVARNVQIWKTSLNGFQTTKLGGPNILKSDNTFYDMVSCGWFEISADASKQIARTCIFIFHRASVGSDETKLLRWTEICPYWLVSLIVQWELVSREPRWLYFVVLLARQQISIKTAGVVRSDTRTYGT